MNCSRIATERYNKRKQLSKNKHDLCKEEADMVVDIEFQHLKEDKLAVFDLDAAFW